MTAFDEMFGRSAIPRPAYESYAKWLETENMHDLQLTYGELPPTVVTVTGSGGNHFFFKAPEGVVTKTDKDVLEKRYTIIEYIQTQWKDIKQIQNQLGNIHDLERLRRYVIQKQISPAQLITIYSNCEKIVTIYDQ